MSQKHHAGGYADFAFSQDVYDHLPAPKGRQDIPFFVEMAKASGGPVLELAVGTGRIAIPTARAGISITGLDLSAFMLAAFRQSLAREPAEVQARVQLVEDDMRQFDLGTRFPLVTIPSLFVSTPDGDRGPTGLPAIVPPASHGRGPARHQYHQSLPTAHLQ